LGYGGKKSACFCDSQLVVHQLNGESQCLDGTLNEYREMCMKIISGLEEFSIQHIPRSDNTRANELAQQAYGYEVKTGKFEVRKRDRLHEILVIQGDVTEAPGGSEAMRND
jgi:ribonuclease HI